MQKTIIGTLVALLAAGAVARDFPIDIPSIPDVRVTDVFWGARMETNRLVTVPAALDRYEQAGRLDNFRNAAARKLGIPYNGNSFEDSDLYRILEGAFLACLAHPDSNLQARAEAIIPIIAAAQEPDGYLYTAPTIDCVGRERRRAGPTRWSNLQDSHELYCMGQLVEAALAHKALTGKNDLMDVMWRNVDLISRTFGNGRSQLKRVPGHESPEIALPKLWRFAHEPATMELIKNFIDWRGRADLRPLYGTPGSTVFDAAYYQDHKPVREQREAVGHAVRACYLYTGMAEMLALTGDQTLRPALDAIWENVVGRKMYVTGGVGAHHAGEKFGADFELPNERGYLETCATLANALWQFRMFRLDGDAKYIDVFERILHNNFAAGVSIGGDAFFYVNPLASHGNVTRWRWHGCPCCPANVVRIIPQLGTYAYATAGDTLYWNLFMASDATLRLKGGDVKVRQTNNGYPWRGDGLALEIDPGAPRAFAVKVRIPGWARGACVPTKLYEQVNPASLDEVSLAVNGQPVALALDKGYATISRTWTRGDRIELSLKMTPRFVRADARVAEDVGRLAVERGPVVYCAEGVDNGGHVLNKYIPGSRIMESRHLGGDTTNVTICGLSLPAIRLPATARTRGVRAVAEAPATLTLVPNFAWSHRGAGEMQTWLPTSADLAEPAFIGRANASHCWKYDTLNALTASQTPSDSAGRKCLHFSFWPNKGTTEWVQYDLPLSEEIRDMTVYWLDDEATKGGCRLPQKVTVKVRPAKDAPWQAVEGATVEIAKDRPCAIRLPKAVTAQAIRLEIVLRPDVSAGLLGWSLAGAPPAAVPPEKMKEIYETVKTPYKRGMVLTPEKGEMLDNPSVFRHKDAWYMIFIRFDGKGYETHLAKSDDLIRWQRLGCIFQRGEKGAWDASQADGWPSLADTRWDGPNTLNTFNGRYWMMYLGGAKDGYETDPLSTGVAWTDDPSAVKQWTRCAGNPVLQSSDPAARAFERATIYKHFTVEDPSRACGGRFVNFYNAADKVSHRETIGMAVSDDMLHWRRVGDVPVIENGDPKRHSISGDPMFRRIGDLWVMFYFGYQWRPGGAFDTFACSYDLKHWTKWDGEPLIKPSADFDRGHAHKPWVLKHNGVVYHYYCAVGSKGRGIALATSAP